MARDDAMLDLIMRIRQVAGHTAPSGWRFLYWHNQCNNNWGRRGWRYAIPMKEVGPSLRKYYLHLGSGWWQYDRPNVREFVDEEELAARVESCAFLRAMCQGLMAIRAKWESALGQSAVSRSWRLWKPSALKALEVVAQELLVRTGMLPAALEKAVAQLPPGLADQIDIYAGRDVCAGTMYKDIDNALLLINFMGLEKAAAMLQAHRDGMCEAWRARLREGATFMRYCRPYKDDYFANVRRAGEVAGPPYILLNCRCCPHFPGAVDGSAFPPEARTLGPAHRYTRRRITPDGPQHNYESTVEGLRLRSDGIFL